MPAKSAEVRLDAATLRWVLALFSGDHGGWGGVYDILRARLAEAEVRPPALSDWVRACEGLGELSMSWEDGGLVLGRGGDGWIVDVNISRDDGRSPSLWIWRHARGKRLVGNSYATPAELRAALDALAREVTP